jgi:transposase
MKSSPSLLNFKDQKLYIGIDVHLRQWTVTIRTRELELQTFSMNPQPKELQVHLAHNYPQAHYFSAYEAGFCGFWVHRQFTQLGIKNIVVNPADVPTTHKERTQKRDKRDSRKIARELADGSLTAIYIPSPEQEALRLLSRLLKQMTRRTTQLKGRIKHFCHTQGISLPKCSERSHWSGRFLQWLQSLAFEQADARYYLDQLLLELAFARQRKTLHLRHVRQRIRGNQIIEYLRTVPGIGLITAVTFYTEIMDIRRFPQLDQLIAFIGLVPAVQASDTKETLLGLTKRYNQHLKSLLIEAAWVAVRHDPALTLAFQKLLKFQSKQRAIIRITKKLVNRLRAVWKNQQPYVLAVVA